MNVLTHGPRTRSGRSDPGFPWRLVGSQVLAGSVLAWAGVGAIVLAEVAIGHQRVGWAFSVGTVIMIAAALTVGLASVALAVSPSMSHAVDRLFSPGRSAPRSAPTEDEERLGLTPLGVTLVVAVELAVVLALVGL
jgi:hypothetical protein